MKRRNYSWGSLVVLLVGLFMPVSYLALRYFNINNGWGLEEKWLFIGAVMIVFFVFLPAFSWLGEKLFTTKKGGKKVIIFLLLVFTTLGSVSAAENMPLPNNQKIAFCVNLDHKDVKMSTNPLKGKTFFLISLILFNYYLIKRIEILEKK